ncbi:MAG: CHASE2 domain-containing protein, partial [Cytophagales bacterium]|nr:CHASE2 domain-containing protein [Cytophagales bacterium]
VHEDEFILIRFTSYIKKLVLKIDKKPPKEHFLFVSVSWDKALIDKLDAEGFPIGNQPVTDREKLAKFLHILNEKPNNHRFLIMDIFFKEPSPFDSALQYEFSRTKNYLCSYHKNEDDSPNYPDLNVKRGLSDYEVSSDAFGFSYGGFAKYKMVQGANDSLKTLPLLMYEHIFHKNLIKKAFWYELDGKPVYNTFILDFRIRPHHLFDDQNPMDKVYLGELLYLPTEAIHELTKNRIIVVGDYEDRDIHETIYGDIPGPLILLNAFLALENYDNEIEFSFLFFLFIGYFLVSYKCFRHKDFFEEFIIHKIFRGAKVRGFIINTLGYVMYFFILSLISYFIFDIHLTIIMMAIYMQLLEKLVYWLEGLKKARQEK